MAIRRGDTHAWQKSTHSGGNGACVEVASPGIQVIAVRDSKDPSGPSLSFSPESWDSFIADVNGGAFKGV
ncbi:DUF397 domain-containing protein [Streptomyces zagrosensis]|uniref:DUF397 domain-containing protein n=1 Tax=Streptomyces zagrosensis TaxID=1042984 RepID=A0A7W9QHP5_9ACTN|nr:DUF397 domain-containing protein [Streptomyces zagrosensis]MBB5939853.1 hypothetical protein [Streptomyces zagrosensis]